MQTRMKWMLVLGVAVLTVACGDSKSSLLPTAPSALSADSANVDAATADGHYGTTANGPKPGNGNGNGNGSGNGNGNGSENGNGNPRTPSNTSPGPTAPVPPGKSVVQFEGLIQDVGPDWIKVSGQQIKVVVAETVIRHGNVPYALGDLNEDDRVHVRARRVEATGGPATAESTLVAELILLQRPGSGEDATVIVDPNPLVSVTAMDDTAYEVTPTGVDTAAFLLTRTGTATQLAAPLTVSIMLSGSADAADYAPISLTANFLAGMATVTIPVTPVADRVVEPTESVTLTLTAASGYETGSPAMATVTIADAPPPVVHISFVDTNAGEIANDGRFELTRVGGNLAAPLTVTVVWSGTAANGVDYYDRPTTWTFAAGQSLLRIFVNPIMDTVVEPAETVVLELVDGADYNLGTPSTAALTIGAR